MNLTAAQFIKELKKLISKTELKEFERYFPLDKRNGDEFIGVQMGKVFALAKQFIEMPLVEIEKLLQSPIHEIRTGAVSIMDFQARNKNTTDERNEELFNLYIRRHDRINNWDLVDRSAIYVVGGYLFECKKITKILYKLARSKNPWERRTAIVSTAYFIKNAEIDDTFKIAELLVDDKDEFVNKATGWMLRYAGDKDKKKLLTFLDKYAATMPRILLRYSIEKIDKKQKDYYLNMKSKNQNKVE